MLKAACQFFSLPAKVDIGLPDPDDELWVECLAVPLRVNQLHGRVLELKSGLNEFTVMDSMSGMAENLS